MDRQYPVYTVETACQDCYKCVRQCPVKAIRVRDGHAEIRPERCVACGHCVQVCPARAKKVRDDTARARLLLSEGRPVYVSLAPSWVSEFPGLEAGRMVGALRALGFAGVSETALGAEQVSAGLARELPAAPGRLHLSSACPAAAAFVARYLPAVAGAVTPVVSPARAHARLLRRWYGPEIAVVFIGPCIAKKLEADRAPADLNLALTFAELRGWWTQAGIEPERLAATDGFVPARAREGVIYPLEGGMNRTLAAYGAPKELELVNLTGLRQIDNALAGLDAARLEHPVFIECLACEGGCVGGPGMSRPNATLSGLLQVRRSAPEIRGEAGPPRETPPPLVDLSDRPEPAGTDPRAPLPLERLRGALARVGKTRLEDELNCGGCGYDTCRQFAQALLEGHAEPAMCASYMRRIAQRQANALLRCLPAGVVIVDRELIVVECNQVFARLFGPETELAYAAEPGLQGARLEKLLPFADLFRAALRSGQDIQRERLPAGNRLLDAIIFTIEPHQTVGAVIQDVTVSELRREQIAQRAREVIHKNLATVQEIACRLGEHMADTEILLSSIAEDYGPEPAAEPAAWPTGTGGGR